MFRCSSTCGSTINLCWAGLSRRFYSTSDGLHKHLEKAKSLAQSLQQIDSDVVYPHLKQKTHWISRNDKDKNWVSKDLEALFKIRIFMQSNESFLHVRDDFICLVDGLTVHAKHRTDIIDLPENKVSGFPENGALIRNLYRYADDTLIRSSISTLKRHKIIELNTLFTEAYLSAEFRRLIRKVLRIAGSVQTANQSAILSLIDSACAFPDRDRKTLEHLKLMN